MRAFRYPVCAIGLAAAAAAQADTVLLLNADRLSGQVQGFDAGKLLVKTDYAGVLRIDLEAIAAWHSEGEMTVVLEDDRRLYGRLEGDATRVKVISAPGVEVELPRERVANMRPGRLTADLWKITGRVLLGASSTSGNSETTQVNLDSKIVARRGKNRYSAGLRGNFATSEGAQTQNDALLTLKFDRFRSKRWYWYASASFEHNPFADIALRTTAGGGTGYQVIATARTNLSLEGGLEYVATDYSEQPSDAFPAARLGLRFDVWLWQDVVQLYTTTSGYGNLEVFGNSFARSETGLRFPLRNGFLAQAAHTTQWQGQPPPGTEAVDQTLTLSVGYQW